jgi:hypothetical protein
MINFFRKIRLRLLSDSRSGSESNKMIKYFIYAIGEIVLVVIGILIALAISEWNDGLKNEEIEQKLLSELYQGIQGDKVIIENELQKINRAITQLEELDNLLSLDIPEPNDRLDSLLGSVYGFRFLRLNQALYEDIKSVGLGIIQNENLRSQIINVFENDYANIEGIRENEQSINMVNRPYYLANFISIQFTIYAHPIDLQTLWQDAYFRNIVHYRIVTLKNNQLIIYQKTISEIDSLLKSIEVQLD